MKQEISSGGVIVRRMNDRWEVFLIRDRNGNWTFPKGLTEKGETAEVTATREIAEETGLTDIRPVAELPDIEYRYDRNGEEIHKTVKYFLFEQQRHQEPVLQTEEGITEAEWVPLGKALISVGYPETNRKILDEAKKLLELET